MELVVNRSLVKSIQQVVDENGSVKDSAVCFSYSSTTDIDKSTNFILRNIVFTTCLEFFNSQKYISGVGLLFLDTILILILLFLFFKSFAYKFTLFLYIQLFSLSLVLISHKILHSVLELGLEAIT